jgi:hypothetical protein
MQMHLRWQTTNSSIGDVPFRARVEVYTHVTAGAAVVAVCAGVIGCLLALRVPCMHILMLSRPWCLQTLRNSLRAPANHSRTCMTSLLTSLSRSVFAMAELMLLCACRWLQCTGLLSRFQEALRLATSCV